MYSSRVRSFVNLTVASALLIAVGCGKSPSDSAASTSPANSTSASAANPSVEAVTRAASDFLDAVLKGDTQRASARLTPAAMQRIVASGKQFAPPGLETATFQVGEVRTPSTDRAFVHCMLTDNSTGTAHSEEMCCLMKLVDNDWRVSGIAYWAGPNMDGTMSDFETGQSMPIRRNPTAPNTAGPSTTPPSGVPASQSVPPRVAQEPTTSSPY